MTPAGRLAAAIELLDAILAERRPADILVSAYVRQRRFIGAKDRAAITALVYGALRHQARLGWWLDRLAPGAAGARARLIAFLRLVEGQSAEAVTALFRAGSYSAPPPDAAEAALIDRLGEASLAAPEMPEAVRLEIPDWAEAPLRQAYGDGFADVAAGLLGEAALDLRVNRLKLTREQALAGLGDLGVPAEPTPLSPLGIRVAGRPPLAGHRLFRDGAVEVQDEASQLAALLVDAAPGQQVVDFCTGAGGKALALAAMMDGKGRVVAADVSQPRLARARRRLARAGVDNIEPKLMRGDHDPLVRRHKRKFDRVLVDAPCSGTGAWRRNPDARWRPVDLDGLTQRQDRILAAAGRLPRPGGRLVYATCSLLPAENEARIDAFLAANPDYRPLPVDQVWPAVLSAPLPDSACAGPYLRLNPAWHGTDGFFVAILERAGDPV